MYLRSGRLLALALAAAVLTGGSVFAAGDKKTAR